MTTYHFIGIKGTGMSALAHILKDAGEKVQGSDVEQYFFTEDELKKKKIPMLPFSKDNIKEDQIVIAGNAFSDQHEEIKEAKRLGLKFYKYHEFLGELLQKYRSIAVTGVHGKTSTTGLLSHVLEENFPVSYLIGDGSGLGNLKSKYFAFEACEYRRHFLAYKPDYAIITNIDYDHPDYFTGLNDVIDAFQSFANQVKKAIIAWGDDENLQSIQANIPIVYYGFNDNNDFQAKNIQVTEEGTNFDVYVRNNFYDSFHIPLFGNHHILNALGVIALCDYEDISKDKIKAMTSFSGVKRRFSDEKVGDQVIIDDYAHHPIEIEATIESARKKYPNQEVVAIFQPHTFTRTKIFLEEFGESLSQADHVYLCDIFGSARESRGELSIKDLQNLIEGSQLLHIDETHKLQKHKNSVLLFMGAGDIQKFQKAYEKTLE